MDDCGAAAPNPQARFQVPADLPGSDIKPCFQRGLAAIRALITVSGPGREPTRQVSRSPGPWLAVPSLLWVHRAGSALCPTALEKPLGTVLRGVPSLPPESGHALAGGWEHCASLTMQAEEGLDRRWSRMQREGRFTSLQCLRCHINVSHTNRYFPTHRKKVMNTQCHLFPEKKDRNFPGEEGWQELMPLSLLGWWESTAIPSPVLQLWDFQPIHFRSRKPRMSLRSAAVIPQQEQVQKGQDLSQISSSWGGQKPPARSLQFMVIVSQGPPQWSAPSRTAQPNPPPRPQ